MWAVLLHEYIVNLDAIDVVVIEPDGVHLTLRSGRSLYIPEADARKLFRRLGFDYDLARLGAEQERIRVAEAGELWDEPWES
jgi:hypothetical protein